MPEQHRKDDACQGQPEAAHQPVQEAKATPRNLTGWRKTVTAIVATTAMPGPRKAQPTEGLGSAVSGATISIIGEPMTNQPTCPITIVANILLTMRTKGSETSLELCAAWPDGSWRSDWRRFRRSAR